MATNITWAKMPTEGVVVITGHRGEGKSALAWWFAEETKKKITRRKKRTQIAALGIPEAARKALPKRIKHIDSVEEVADLKPSIVVLDEASFIANSRRSQSANNVMWLQLIAVCRHKGHLLIFINQHNRQLDVQILADADYVIMKKPTALHLRFCRTEFKPELKKAFDAFNALRGDSKKKAYAVNYHTAESVMLPSRMPTWWSDRVSKAYGTVSFKPDDAEGKVK